MGLHASLFPTLVDPPSRDCSLSEMGQEFDLAPPRSGDIDRTL